MKNFLKDKRTFFLVLLSFFGCIIFFQNVTAIEYAGIGGQPAYPKVDNPRTQSIFIHTLEPSEVIEDGVRVVNNTKEEKTLNIYAADAISTNTGGFACKQKNDKQTNVGTWINVVSSSVVLAPESSTIVSFIITAPENISAGEYNGCILIQEAPNNEAKSAGVNLSFRSGLRVSLNVPGEVFKELSLEGLEILPQENRKTLFSTKVKNTGNVSVDAEVEIIVKNLFGKEIFRNNGRYPILRNEVAEWNFIMDAPVFGGFYNIDHAIGYNNDPQVTLGTDKFLTKILTGEKQWFVVWPVLWKLISLVVISVLILFGIFWKMYSFVFKKHEKDTWKRYTVKKGDTLMKLAKKRKISWKKIAKFNKIKPPYTLETGDKILLPTTKKSG